MTNVHVLPDKKTYRFFIVIWYRMRFSDRNIRFQGPILLTRSCRNSDCAKEIALDNMAIECNMNLTDHISDIKGVSYQNGGLWDLYSIGWLLLRIISLAIIAFVWLLHSKKLKKKCINRHLSRILQMIWWRHGDKKILQSMLTLRIPRTLPASMSYNFCQRC